MQQKTTSMSIRVNPELKSKAEALFDEMGMSISTAFNIFLSQAIYERAIPFSIARHTPNHETLKAMEEANQIASDPNIKKYDNLDEFLQDLKS